VSALPAWLLEASLPGLGRPLSEAEAGQADNYLNILAKWQKAQRLVGSAERSWLVENVLLDSLCFLEPLPGNARVIADLGSGAGIPGIPIAIARPDLRVSLIEARERRVSFLSTVVRELGLGHVSVIAGRADGLDPDHRGRFDAVVMRCAGRIDDVLGVGLGLVRTGGAVIVSAGPDATVPPHAEEFVIRTPSGTLRRLHRYRKGGDDFGH
jgi:16S rRNA (guanine527-N7)-methyltransferase